MQTIKNQGYENLTMYISMTPMILITRVLTNHSSTAKSYIEAYNGTNESYFGIIREESSQSCVMKPEKRFTQRI